MVVSNLEELLLACNLIAQNLVKHEIRTRIWYSGSHQFFSIVIAEYPWQVAILKKEEFDNVYICGGSLIDGSHILTAAHCIKDYKPQDIR